jgi:putative hydrolase of HD superfamily
MAIIGLEQGMKLGLDSSKIVRMCLLHDLAESVIGDRLPEEKSSPSSHRNEEDKIMQELLKDLNAPISKILLNDWVELVESKTREARLVWRIDKLEMAIQAREYEHMGYDGEKLREFTKSKVRLTD